MDAFDNTAAYGVENRVLANDGAGRFSDWTDQAGAGLRVKRSSRGAGFANLDGDGDLDVVVLSSRREPTVLENLTPPRTHHWLGVKGFGR